MSLAGSGHFAGWPGCLISSISQDGHWVRGTGCCRPWSALPSSSLDGSPFPHRSLVLVATGARCLLTKSELLMAAQNEGRLLSGLSVAFDRARDGCSPAGSATFGYRFLEADVTVTGVVSQRGWRPCAPRNHSATKGSADEDRSACAILSASPPTRSPTWSRSSTADAKRYGRGHRAWAAPQRVCNPGLPAKQPGPA